MAGLWNRWAWALLALLLFAGGIWCWVSGDTHGHYNGYLVALGWACFLLFGYLCARKPAAQQILSDIRAHGLAIVSSGILLLVLFAIVLAIAGDVVIYFAPTATYGYAWKYNVAASNVVVEKRPYDCEWTTAPLGAKHCHYESQVLSVRTGIATDGTTPVLSYDEGKTWATNADRVKPSAYVSWNKIAD